MALHPQFPTSPCEPLVPDQREFKHLEALNPKKFGNRRLSLKPFSPEETREIVFKTTINALTASFTNYRE